MSEPMVRIEGLGKCYRLRHVDEARYVALRDVITSALSAPLRWLRAEPKPEAVDDFWALKDVSFDIARGDVVGIIGRNGAGKSTLLKILSRITEPTRGRVTLNGRVASLLEVGTGFHPELSGRENIFLNAAILGMSRAEIARKFDEIVAFAEVERFLDTPVKRYSSGMYVRLAFGVAAHLEPDVLIVDEVLAVGDAEFQKKSLGKMRDVSQSGRTVLFVSHNMAAIQTLCTRGIWLDQGSVAFDGTAGDAVNRYLSSGSEPQRITADRAVAMGATLRLERLDFTPNPVASGAPVRFALDLRASDVAKVSEIALLILSAQETRVAIVDLREQLPVTLSPGQVLSLTGTIAAMSLVEGDYRIGAYVVAGDHNGDRFDLAELRVLAATTPRSVAPYPAMYRGFVELGASVEVSSGR